MPDIVSIPTAYLIAAVAAVVGTYVFYYLYNRREERREWAQQASAFCREWGLSRIADILDAYARGDYSQIVRTIRKFVIEMRTGPQAPVNMLWDATKKVAAYVTDHDQDKADELRKLLSAGKTAVKAAVAGTATATASGTNTES